MMREVFGTTSAGESVERVTLTSDALTVKVLTYGAILQDVRLTGVAHSLTLGTETFAPYERDMAVFGGLMGPVVNRISGAQAAIDGTVYTFEPAGDLPFSLHSGAAGTHLKLWELRDLGADFVTLGLVLPEGEGGFPGRREVTARFSVAGAALTLEVTAETDAPTILNFANHSYWNLDGSDHTGGHRLRIAADRVTESDAHACPTGRILEVAGTGFDFRDLRAVPAPDAPRLDNSFCLAEGRRALSFAAEVVGADGVSLVMETTEPGLQVYDGGGIGGPDRVGGHHKGYSALALEAQGWPDAPSHGHFPSIRVDPGETYRQVTRWRFAQTLGTDINALPE